MLADKDWNPPRILLTSNPITVPSTAALFVCDVLAAVLSSSVELAIVVAVRSWPKACLENAANFFRPSGFSERSYS